MKLHPSWIYYLLNTLTYRVARTGKWERERERNVEKLRSGEVKTERENEEGDIERENGEMGGIEKGSHDS